MSVTILVSFLDNYSSTLIFGVFTLFFPEKTIFSKFCPCKLCLNFVPAKMGFKILLFSSLNPRQKCSETAFVQSASVSLL